MLIYILSEYVYELAMVCHVFSQYIYFSLSVLSCFGVIDCGQDKYDNEQKRSTYVHAFLLDDFKNKWRDVIKYTCFFFILGINVLLIIIWFEETVKVRKWKRKLFWKQQAIYEYVIIITIINIFLYLACPSGYFGINCLFNCPYPFFGRLCTHKCNCNQSECDFIKGCQNHGKTIFSFSKRLIQHHFNQNMNKFTSYKYFKQNV